jgi:hypothetical protein
MSCMRTTTAGPQVTRQLDMIGHTERLYRNAKLVSQPSPLTQGRSAQAGAAWRGKQQQTDLSGQQE